MPRLPVSYLVLVGLAGLIHLDWHLGRPQHMRLSLGPSLARRDSRLRPAGWLERKRPLS